MEYIIADILLFPFGWLIMQIKFRDSKKRINILKSEYGNSYSSVAKDHLFSLFLIVFAILIFALIGVTIYKSIF